ncbi:hybrid sensor histidine kinase/response regulator [Ruegeria lacuscaerulensis]|uniref:hybrid sensor histidine kinase/response regulator n=1 Tax=Ruegeria lacuscaerulensis TaxID=55218 RepID=UPI001480CD28|nr:response regulator [Ruegeria lacuscaerulensis]
MHLILCPDAGELLGGKSVQDGQDKDYERELRIHEALDVASTTPVFALSFLMAFVVMILQFGPANLTLPAVVSLALLLAMNVMGMKSYYALRNKPRPKSISKRRLKVILITSVILGTTWGCFNFFMMPVLAPHEQMVLYLFAFIGAFGGSTTFSLRVTWGFSSPVLFLTWLSMLLWGPLEWYFNTLTILGTVLAITQLTFLTRKSAINGIKLSLANTKALNEQLKAEGRIRELARIPEENPNPVLRISDEGKLIYANRASAPLIKALGFKVGAQVAADWRERVSRGMTEDERQDFEHAAGDLIYALLLWPVPDGGYANVYGRDITTQKRVESELRVARDIAEAASQTKSSFLANMSHELRTPLNAIIGYSELMLEEAIDQNDEANLNDLKKIQSAGKHLLALINDVLDLSKIEAGKMEFTLDTFDISQVINDVSTTVQPLAEKNDNTLEISCPEDIGEMVCDLTKVRQALLNLLSNACKFTENEKITLSVVESNEGGQLEFAVSDHGIGMSPEQADRIFNAFTQADSSTTRNYGGTGLGLSITKAFCEQLGGDIHCDSTLGEGSTFTIRLPRICKDPSADLLQRAEFTEGSVNSDPNAPLVLLVDDDPTVHDLLGRRLVREGYRVLASTNGDQALELARTTRPDAITLDVFMPEIDGWAVLSKLKEDPELGNIPVIMLTFAEDRKRGLSLGASEYLDKPIDTVALLKALKEHCPTQPTPTVLVVEDEVATRELICRVLGREGWQIDEAVNGLDALQRLSQSVPDVILLDLMMPEMDGFEFLAGMKKNPDWKDIPVIIVTAKTLSSEDRIRLNGSVDTLIQKGGDEIETILAQLNEILLTSRSGET